MPRAARGIFFTHASSMKCLRAIMLTALATVAGACQAESLSELLALAKAHDAVFLAAQAQARSAVYKARQSDALLRPSLSLSAGASREREDYPAREASSVSTLGALTSSTAQVSQFNDQQQLALQARQPLYNRHSVLAIDEAQATLASANVDLELAEQDLISRLSQACFDLLAAQDALAAAQANARSIDEQFTAANRRYELGKASITDQREAQARRDQARYQQLAADKDRRERQLGLDQLTGRPGATPNPLASEAADTTPLPALEDWLALGDSAPAIRKGQLAVHVAQDELDMARAGHLPTLDLIANASRARNSLNTYTAPSGYTNIASISVQANIPLYAGMSVQNRIRETIELLDKASEDLVTARRQTELGIRQGYLDWLSSQEQIQALRTAQASADTTTEKAYQLGVRTNLDVLNAQSQHYDTLRQTSRARSDHAMAWIKLRQAAGTLRAQDLQTLDALIRPAL